MMKVDGALAVNRDAITWKLHEQQVPYSCMSFDHCMSFYQDLKEEAEGEIQRVKGIVFNSNYGVQGGPVLFNQNHIHTLKKWSKR